ncbi:cytochrome oxidase c assembly-domain-containing protein [Schizothecium vesticola]|uniref:Cytochrome oxidase c assembly-domain-containing protein n=1 Tax=Schizothecium vesticola TaxID=314040 RepID=A0AA40EPC1_9PEZI|nr:cytochrome oxidase c assembly-domain-containing protein [Schizothecium vesticola]
MPAPPAPRSVSDATRFTAATPHASSKTASRLAPPAPSSSAKPIPPGSGSGTPPPFVETPEQRVARLRAAHRRAAAASVSKFDRIVDSSRRLFDSAHKIAVMSIITATAVAGLVTVYTAADMIMYNRKRKAEFLEAQRRLEASSLEAARLAYMTGKATDEQILLVEEASERDAPIFSRPSQPLPAGQPLPQKVSEAATWPAATPPPPAAAEMRKSSGTGLWAWLTSSLKKEEEGDEPMTAQRRLGYESLSEEDDGTGMRDSDLVRAAEGRAAALREKAHEAFEREKAAQREGGPLDRVGTEKPGKKSGWW